MECKNYPGAKTIDGYGKNSKGLIHRQEYFKHYPDADKKLQVHHLCNNPSCYEISHLTLGTPKDNAIYRSQCGRSGDITKGKNGRAKLYPDLVEDMKGLRALKWSYAKIATFYGVSPDTVHKALNGRWEVE